MTNDQPHANGFNAKAKVAYYNENNEWNKRFVAVPYTPTHVNTVLVKIWAHPSCKSGSIIVKLFDKTHCVPLRPPNTHKAVASDFLVSLQILSGKKSIELDVIRENTTTIMYNPDC